MRLTHMSIRRQLALVVAIFGLSLVLLLPVAGLALKISSGVRAFVGGEALWSKAQKDGTQYLMRYLLERDPADYEAFQRSMEVPLGDGLARTELDSPEPDLEVVRRGLTAGGNHPDDHDDMIFLFRTFRNVGFFEEAIELWGEGDYFLQQLIDVGEEVHHRIESETLTEEGARELREKIEELNFELTPVEEDFSSVLSEAARGAQSALLVATVVVSIGLFALALAMALVTSRQLFTGIGALQAGAERARRGDFSRTIDYRAENELGDLGRAFDQMILARAEAEEQLTLAVTKLASSNRELQDFAYVASHDLQSPLRKIQVFADRARSTLPDPVDADVAFSLDRIQAVAARMRELIDGLLALSRVKTKAEPFVPVDLGELTAEVLSDLEVKIDLSGARIEVGPLPTLEADPTQLRQLIQNLLENALKFRRADVAPVVSVVADRVTTEGTAVCRLIVADNGVGFDDGQAVKIFEAFHRLHGQETEGFGLGLAICSRIVERHGGEIRAESSGDSGARFVVTLPLRQPATDEA